MQDTKDNNYIESLMSFFKKSPQETKNESPDGLCANCWGEQEYDNVIRNMYKDKQIQVNNHEAHYSFVQEFVVERLNGIHLVNKNNSNECPTCRVITK